MEANKIVIIGGGIAGLSAAQAARETDAAARIHLVCGEERLPYYRPRICEIFAGLDPAKLTVRSHQWFIDNRIEVVFGRVTSVSGAQKQVKFADGSYLGYDALVIATGAKGNVPDARGNDAENVLPLRFLADIERIRKIEGPTVIVGDGLLGLEAAWQLSRAGREVAVIGRGDRLLSRQLDKEGSVFFLGIVEQAGVRVALNGELTVIEGGRALLADGRAFDAALVIFAAGIKSVFTLAGGLGLATGRGIVVDSAMRTSAADIYAAGDCAEYEGRVYGVWTASMAQGAVAGANAAGASRAYQPEQPAYLMNAMGTKIWSYGDIESEDGESRRQVAAGAFAKFFFRDGLLAGAELIHQKPEMIQVKKAVDAGLAREAAVKLLETL